MTTITDAEVKQKGLGALLEALGEVDAERFITLLNRDPFDYTVWQKNLFENISVQEISAKAMLLKKKNS
ncbi:hypothetical protein HDF24_22255 [Mucilaginibacter sp. X4EP1]|jgi:hypothetical protein|uniref:hypothetical protein n=1 Tax=Mucilaginibacter sp. X4EP1 TaxID=2723092 RepID=UPI002168B348|nr:hypothetical protein [Mucilaginibacter sp. X4EP1]MCS3812286.1 hypothetical protein [Mucilaginibacter sp. X4EP1]